MGPACSATGSRSARSPAMFHGDDERVDVGSLGLQAALWDGVVRELLG